MARRIELKGKAGSCVAVVVLSIAAWTILGRPFFDFNLGIFSQGYQVALFRGGQFAMQGLYWQEHDRTLGTIVSTGSETLAVGLDAEIERGTLVILAWRWPAFLFDEPILHRARYGADVEDNARIPLPGPGIYKLSASGIRLRGDIALEWRIDAAD